MYITEHKIKKSLFPIIFTLNVVKQLLLIFALKRFLIWFEGKTKNDWYLTSPLWAILIMRLLCTIIHPPKDDKRYVETVSQLQSSGLCEWLTFAFKQQDIGVQRWCPLRWMKMTHPAQKSRGFPAYWFAYTLCVYTGGVAASLSVSTGCVQA